ncbi:hypothetical protein C7212DRAFT_363483 [Tuber magnatum]|uniref:Uncharacterized protein n=1 Tax=Tuber magnatum TaxID=42249 RepID=A0A317SQY3_9PEZI|nr:hypothetical protein C7212DRAFT_363483 [Tuber magnatum]
MLSSKLLRLLIHSHQFHPKLCGGPNPIARRGFTCTPGKRSDGDGLPAHDQNLGSPAQSDTCPVWRGASPKSEEFHLLNKDITILKTHVNDIKLDLKDLHRTVKKTFGDKFDDVHRKIDMKCDRLMLLIVGCMVLKGGFDIYREEHKGFTEVQRLSFIGFTSDGCCSQPVWNIQNLRPIVQELIKR